MSLMVLNTAKQKKAKIITEKSKNGETVTTVKPAPLNWIILFDRNYAFDSVEALKIFLKKQEKEIKLEWLPGCCIRIYLTSTVSVKLKHHQGIL